MRTTVAPTTHLGQTYSHQQYIGIWLNHLIPVFALLLLLFHPSPESGNAQKLNTLTLIMQLISPNHRFFKDHCPRFPSSCGGYSKIKSRRKQKLQLFQKVRGSNEIQTLQKKGLVALVSDHPNEKHFKFV